MRYRTQTFVLSIAALLSLADVFLAPRDRDPGPWAAAVLAILLVRRAIITTHQPTVVILAGCMLTILLLAGNHRLLNVNEPIWLAFVLVSGICYAFWERIERFWIERF
jgi:hypothetical protein